VIVIATVAIFAIGSIVAGVNAQPSNLTINTSNLTAGSPVINCTNGKSLTYANLQAGQNCSNTGPPPAPTPAPVVNSTPPAPTPAPTPIVKPTMTTYKDPEGRFTIVAPSNFISFPQTDRFSTTLVKFDNLNSSSLSINQLPQTSSINDPESIANGVQTEGSLTYTLNQAVECSKYHINGEKTCSIIFVNPPDVNLGTQGRVVEQLISYQPSTHQMYSIDLASDEPTFDTVLPTFDAMIHSLHFGGNSVSVGPAGTGIATGSSASNNPNLLH
jgi:hypothetical protein